MEILGQKLKEGYFSIEKEGQKIRYKIEKIRNGYKISGKIRGNLGYVKILEIERPREKLYINNWQSWGPFFEEEEFKKVKEAEINRKIGIYTYTPIPEIFKIHLISDYYLVGDSLFLGFLTSKVAHPYFVVKEDVIEGYFAYFDTKFDEYIEMEPLVVLTDLPQEKLLPYYADFVKIENKIRIARHNPIGWSTWYQYFLDLKWEDVIKNLELSKEIDMPYEVFQIDDAYEKEIGDWLITKKGFPPIGEMAKTIEDHGYIPGIWTAPLSIGERSSVYSEHKDWLVKEAGSPKKAYYNWEEDIYALDITNNDAKNWLFSLFSELKRAGYEYFKIDFMFAGALPGERKLHITPIQAYREALKVIRDAVGDSFVLGCGAPLLSSIGFVDGMRIGPDAAPSWGRKEKPGDLDAYWALKDAITRWFMHKKWWLNDPDCLILREEDTALTPSQRELYAVISGILDNMLIQSDDLSYVKEDGKRLFEKAMSLQRGRPYVKFLDNDLFIIGEEGGKSGNIKICANIGEKAKTCNNEEIAPISYKILKEDEKGVTLEKKAIKREDGRMFTYYEGNN